MQRTAASPVRLTIMLQWATALDVIPEPLYFPTPCKANLACPPVQQYSKRNTEN